MSRSITDDKLLACRFHLIGIDVSPSLPPWVLAPWAGFKSITAPGFDLEKIEIKEGTDPFVHHRTGKASTNEITLQKGVDAFNSDFWRWIVAFIHGNNDKKSPLGGLTLFPPLPAKRRDFILIHYTGISLSGLGFDRGSDNAIDVVQKGLLAVGAGLNAITLALALDVDGLKNMGTAYLPGKVYYLHGCIPTGYKPASDFDAMSSDISVEELTMSYHYFEEFSFTG